MDACTITSDKLSAVISSHGAELHSLQMASGEELIWDADPAYWARHAPHLFPIVGRLANDTLVHKGRHYPMGQHGFARDLPFEVEASNDTSCTLLLRDNETTRAKYPFAFELRVTFRLEDNRLVITYRVNNSGDETLPCSIGAHPAFAWPLPGNDDRGKHVISFSETERCTIRRLHEGLLLNNDYYWPWADLDNTLPLHHSLFEPDAMIFTEHASRKLTYHGEHGPAITVEFDDFPHLGIWGVPGAGFVCIEPWQGHASPVDFEGEFSDKPGIVKIEPGEERSWTMTIQVDS